MPTASFGPGLPFQVHLQGFEVEEVIKIVTFIHSTTHSSISLENILYFLATLGLGTNGGEREGSLTG